MRKSIWRIPCFLLVCIALLGVTVRVFEYKAEEPYRNLHALKKNSTDVLVLGTSHAYSGFYTNVMWSEYGVAAYILSGPGQTLWDAYHALRDALTTQTPKLVVLDAYALQVSGDYAITSHADINTRGLRWSANKVDALFAAFPGEEVADHLLGYPLYHTRYNRLSEDDFRLGSNHPENKGTFFVKHRVPYEPPAEPEHPEAIAPAPKAESYYRMIIELCLERDIPLLVTVVPYKYAEEDYGIMLSAGMIAEEYGIPFLDGNGIAAEIGIDYATCTSDGTHLNYLGGPIFTRYFTQYIKACYDLPDRRGDAAYASWQRDADILERQLYNRTAWDGDNLTDFLALFSDETYGKIVCFSGSCIDTDEGIASCLEAIGVNPCGEGGIRFVCAGETRMVCLPGEEQYLSVGKHDFYFKSVTADITNAVENTVLLDREVLTKNTEPNGLTVTVYDMVLQEPVVSFVTWKDNGYNGFEWVE